MAEQTRIRVAFQGLCQTEKKLYDLAGALEQTGNVLEETLSDVQAVWEGRAKESFRETGERLAEQTKKMSEELEKQAAQLGDALSVYERTEEEAKSMAQELSAADIF